MKLFETTFNTVAYVGFEWDKSSNKFVCTKKLFIPYIICVLSLCAFIKFLIYDADTFYEYTLGFSCILSGIWQTITIVIFTINVTMFDNLIVGVENMINKSK